jgi:hypothetical protein
MSKDKLDEMVSGGGSAEDALTEAEEQSSALTLYSDQIDFSPDDVYIPRLRLAQGLTKEVQEGTARPGQYLVTGFAPEEDVTLVPVGFTKMREYRNPDDGSEMLCFSRNALEGEGDPGGVCAECPLSKWTEDSETGKRKKPACAFSYGYLFYSQEHDTITSFKFKGMALNAGKMLNTIVNHHGLGNIAVKLASESKSLKGNSFFVPGVSVATEFDEGLFETAKKAYAAGM